MVADFDMFTLSASNSINRGAQSARGIRVEMALFPLPPPRSRHAGTPPSSQCALVPPSGFVDVPILRQSVTDSQRSTTTTLVPVPCNCGAPPVCHVGRPNPPPKLWMVGRSTFNESSHPSVNPSDCTQVQASLI